MCYQVDPMSLTTKDSAHLCFPFAGTTCLIALLSDKELTVANVGDSRGVLCDKDGNAIPLSHDHKPYQLKERKRIKRAGKILSAQIHITGCNVTIHTYTTHTRVIAV